MDRKKIAVVTGGSSGIGKAIVEKLAQLHYKVINADIHPDESVSGSHYLQCDVSKAEDIHHLYTFVHDHFGVPNVLISNAGQGIHEKITEGDPEKWTRIIDINLTGALRFVRAFLPGMLQRSEGSILFISSTAAKQAYPYGGVYSASKAALNMVAKTLQLEVEGKLRVGLIAPGVVDTAFFKDMVSGFHSVADIGWGSISPQQVAELVAHALLLPPTVNLSEITITPTSQPS
jgi:NADP-dependent 3-hydroxy acid dehydrogenase YdfG